MWCGVWGCGFWGFGWGFGGFELLRMLFLQDLWLLCREPVWILAFFLFGPLSFSGLFIVYINVFSLCMLVFVFFKYIRTQFSISVFCK